MTDFFGMGGAQQERSVKHGISLARVTSITDPKNLGRVKCSFVTSDKDAGETGWIYCVTLFGGNGSGTFFHPNVGDIVALAFENGEVERPIVLGSVWIEKNKPPLAVKDGKNDDYTITTPNKSVVELHDEKGKERISVTTPKKRALVLDDEKELMSLSDGKNAVEIDGKKGEITIKAEKKLTLKVGSGVTVTFDGTAGGVKVDAKKELSVSSAQVAVKASGTAEIKGSGSVTVQSSGVLTLKGSMTKIN